MTTPMYDYAARTYPAKAPRRRLLPPLPTARNRPAQGITVTFRGAPYHLSAPGVVAEFECRVAVGDLEGLAAHPASRMTPAQLAGDDESQTVLRLLSRRYEAVSQFFSPRFRPASWRAWWRLVRTPNLLATATADERLAILNAYSPRGGRS